MKKILLAAALLLATTLAARGAVIRLDIDTMRTSGTATDAQIVTQEGFVSYDATDAPEGTVTLDGVTLTLFGGLDGSRNRAPNAAITGHPYEAVLRDFVFNDGANAGVGLRISGLEPETYDVQSFHYDAGAGISGNFQIEVRDPAVAGSTVILHDNVPMSPDPYAYRITVTDPGQTLELVFREDDAANRSRLNGIIIAPVPEPAMAALALLPLLAFAAGRSDSAFNRCYSRTSRRRSVLQITVPLAPCGRGQG